MTERNETERCKQCGATTTSCEEFRAIYGIPCCHHCNHSAPTTVEVSEPVKERTCGNCGHREGLHDGAHCLLCADEGLGEEGCFRFEPEFTDRPTVPPSAPQTCRVSVMREHEPVPSQYNGEKAWTSGACGKSLPCADHPSPSAPAEGGGPAYELEGELPCSDETCICCPAIWPKVKPVLAQVATLTATIAERESAVLRMYEQLSERDAEVREADAETGRQEIRANEAEHALACLRESYNEALCQLDEARAERDAKDARIAQLEKVEAMAWQAVETGKHFADLIPSLLNTALQLDLRPALTALSTLKETSKS